MWRRISLGLAVVAGASAIAGGALATTGHSRGRDARSHARHAHAAANRLCGKIKTPPKIKHVVVIFFENNPYTSIYHSPSAPYINSVIGNCGLATNYHNITHPSLPNYMAATTGASLAQLAPYLPDQPPSPANEWTGNNIFNQVNVKGRHWKGYAESMPSHCNMTNSGFYAARHNPAVYDTDLTNCSKNDIPLGTTSSSPLLHNFSSERTAPAYATITPNLCDDMHGAAGCPSNLIKTGDNWLHTWLPKLASSAVYKTGDTVVFITWDEGEGGSGSSGEDCSTNTTDTSCHVVTMVVARSVKAGRRVGTLFNHYSLLRSSEELLGLSKLGQARTANSMVKPFNL